MFCQKCGTRALDDAEFCQKCGSRLIVDDTTLTTRGDHVSKIAVAPPTVNRNTVVTMPPKRSKLPIILVSAGVVIAIVILFVSLRGGRGGNNSSLVSSNASSQTSSDGKLITFGSTFGYKGMEYTIADTWSIYETEWTVWFTISVTATNTSNTTTRPSLPIDTVLWDPNGISQIGAFFTTGGDMRPGASKTEEFTYEFSGDGVYTFESESIGLVITLPITRSSTSPSRQTASSNNGNRAVNNSSVTSGELHYKGIPVSQLFADYWITDILGKALVEDGNYYEFEGMTHEFVPEYGRFFYVYDLSVLTAGGTALSDKNMAELTAMLGEPDYEGWSEFTYLMEYTHWPIYIITIEMVDPSGYAFFLTISPYWDGAGDNRSAIDVSPGLQPAPSVYNPQITLNEAINDIDYWLQITINWDRSQTVFTRDSYSGVWTMLSRDGSSRVVDPSFSMVGSTITIGFPTTSNIYYLYSDNTGIFGNENLTWSFETG